MRRLASIQYHFGKLVLAASFALIPFADAATGTPVSLVTNQACPANSLYLESSFEQETDLSECSDPGCKMGMADQFVGIRNLAQATGAATSSGPYSAQPPLPWQCFASVMSLRPTGKGFNYANCAGNGGSDAGLTAPCVTPAYITAVQSAFQQAMNCLGIDEREVFSLFGWESSFQVNIWNGGGVGIGQLTSIAIADVDLNRRFAEDVNKPQCRQFEGVFEQSGENYSKLVKDNGKYPVIQPCQWTNPSQNPILNFLYAGATYRIDKAAAESLASEVATGSDADQIATEIARFMYNGGVGGVRNVFDLFVTRQDPQHKPMSAAQFDTAFSNFLSVDYEGDGPTDDARKMQVATYAGHISTLTRQVDEMTESTACSE